MSDYDYTVVGTGPASYFLCLGILKKNPLAKIKIFEAGSKKNLLETNNFSFNQEGQNFNLKPTTFIGYGGTSNLWHNVIAPLDEEDFIERDWIEDSGWPIRKGDLDKFYKEVATELKFNYELFDEKKHSDTLINEKKKINFEKSIFENKYFLQLKNPFRANLAFDKLKQKHNIDISLNHRVLRILVNSQGKTEAIEIGYKKQKYMIKVKNLIVCCGAIETTKILLNSKITQLKSSPLGLNFMDHPMGNVFQMEYGVRKITRLYSDLDFSKTLKIKSAIKLTAQAQRKYKLPNNAFYLRPSFSKGIDNSTEKVKIQLLAIREKLLKYQLPIEEGFKMLFNLNLARQIILYKTGLSAGHSFADYMFVSEQTPNDKSKITLTSDYDDYGMKKININWNISETDIASITNMYELCEQGLAQQNDAQFTIKKNEINWRSRLSSAAHHLGTARMGNDVQQSVVDKNLKVHGTQNLYISDGSVFPTAGNANSTYTVMALSMRLGDFLES